MKNLKDEQKIYLYLVLVYLFSWLIWIPLDLSYLHIGTLLIPEGISNLVRLLGVLGPAFISLVLTRSIGGKNEVKVLWNHVKIWRVSYKWWVAAVILPQILFGITVLIYNFSNLGPKLKFIDQNTFIGIVIQIIMLTIAAFGEEIGWRGFLLPELQKKYSALSASIILAFIWFIWHIPFWMLQDIYYQLGWSYWLLNFIGIFPISIFLTWIYNNSKESILLPVVYHLSFNIFNVAIMLVTSLIMSYLIFIVLQWIVAIFIILIFKPQKFMKK